MLDEHRAGLDAGAAGRAGPELLLARVAADDAQILIRLPSGGAAGRLPALEGEGSDIGDDLAWVERLAGRAGRADAGAAPAFGAGVAVEDIAPGEGRQLVRAEGLDRLVRQVGAGEPPNGFELPEVDVRGG